MKVHKQKLIIYNSFFAIILCLLLAINVVATHWDQALTLYLGKVGASSNPYISEYKSDEELRQAQETVVSEIVDEGSVLLKNDNNTLPLASSSKITIFGQSSVYWHNGAIGSTSMQINQNMNLMESLEHSGFKVNQDVWNYYKNSGKKAGSGGSGQSNDWSLNETPFNYIKNNYSQSLQEYSEVALVIFSRNGCEGGDLPREMSRFDGKEDEHYLELSSTEIELLKGIKDFGYSKTIVLIKSSFMIDADFLDNEEYNVGACLYVASTGNNGIEEIGKILNGSVNPSGHLANVMVYDNMSSPAMQNFGDFRYVDSNGNLVAPKYCYLNYAETIYVGYKYYETKYEDKVLKQGNADNYDYLEEVKYPFGYGLSYTDFKYSDFKMTTSKNNINISINVTNVGNVVGKDAVQIYFQSPYTQYDIDNGVEKASINLCAFAKTNYLKPGKTEKITLSFDITDTFKSYDYKLSKSYVLEAGDYYISIADNSHSALNNILAKKGYDINDGMTKNGDVSLAAIYHVDSTIKIEKDLTTNYDVTNRFEDAIANNGVYLSRHDWSKMNNNGLRYATGTLNNVSYTTDKNGMVYTRVANEELITNLKNISYKSTGRPEDKFDSSETIYGLQKGISFKDMNSVDIDSDKWDEFVQQMTIGEIHKLYNTAGYGTQQVESVGLPSTKIFDGSIGLVSYVSDWQAYAYPYTTMLACSFNVKLAERTGALIAEDAMRWNVTGWYAPAVNIQRTPFSGRNFDYFSEDPILTGMISAYEIKGAQEKGLVAFVKHFAVNDQETERSNASMWLTEQSLREVYLKPFEITVKLGNAHGLMASMNRIGYRYTRGSYPLMTEVLRNEWGFKGATITDFTASNKQYSDMALAAGIDLQLNTTANALTTTKTNEIRHDLQRAAKNTCYMISKSLIMNFYSDGKSKYSDGYPVYKLLLIGIDAITIAVCGIEEILLIKAYKKKKKIIKVLEGE